MRKMILAVMAAVAGLSIADASTWVADDGVESATTANNNPVLLADAKRRDLLASDHPLVPVLRYAYEGYDRMRRDIRDYSCVLIKRERINGKLSGYQHIEAKIRHQRDDSEPPVPFSVFLHFLGPDSLKDREVLFVRGQNNNDLIARRGGQRSPNMTLRLDPSSPLAMDGNRYPITEIGIEQLVAKLIEVGEEEVKYPECEVKMFANAQLNGRSCTHIQVMHPMKREYFRYHIARIFIDDELKVPIYYASYDWPRDETSQPRLMEEYAYTKLKLNVGFTDATFSPTNPDFHFQLE